jgi:hypothetical protein
MTIQLDTTLRNNMVGQYESTIGPSPRLQLRTGAPPANCAAADTGTLLSEIVLPADWMTAAASGSISLLGSWAGTGLPAAGAGTPVAHYRLKNSGLTTTFEQGTVTATGNGGDLTVDNTSVANNQPVSVTSWVRTQGGA